MKETITIFGAQIPAEIFLTTLAALLGVVAMFVSLVMRKREADRTNIEELLSNKDIIEALNGGNEAVKQLVGYLKERDARRRENPPGLMASIFGDISKKIEWDVAGLIGIIVTIVLMIMVISQSVDGIPKEVFAGWLTIIGYYFGKASAKGPSAAKEQPEK